MVRATRRGWWILGHGMPEREKILEQAEMYATQLGWNTRNQPIMGLFINREQYRMHTHQHCTYPCPCAQTKVSFVSA